jgi:hypothetical protein
MSIKILNVLQTPPLIGLTFSAIIIRISLGLSHGGSQPVRSGESRRGITTVGGSHRSFGDDMERQDLSLQKPAELRLHRITVASSSEIGWADAK